MSPPPRSTSTPAPPTTSRSRWPPPPRRTSAPPRPSRALTLRRQFLIAPLVRGRGAWLATITAFVGFVGVSTMPGLLLSDWFDSAVVAAHGLEGHHAMTDAMEGMWGIPFALLPGIVPLFVALPLAMATLWRAGLARWWGLVAAVGAIVAFTGSNATWPGTVLATVLLTVVSVALAQATDRAARAA